MRGRDREIKFGGLRRSPARRGWAMLFPMHMTKQWAKREEQIRGVIESTAGMYGDLQGIAGKRLLEIEGLDVKLLGESQ